MTERRDDGTTEWERRLIPSLCHFVLPFRRSLFTCLVVAAGCKTGEDAPPAATPPQHDDDWIVCEPPVPEVPDAPARAATVPLVRYVDPRIGTGGVGFGVGSTYPGPARPFGMVHPSPDTSTGKDAVGFSHCAGYAYDDTFVEGFSLTHANGMGIPEYGSIGIMPVVGMSPEKTKQSGYRSRFSHARETVSAGYYAVTLDDSNVRVEITAAERVAVLRATFPQASDAHVLVDIGHLVASDGMKIADGRVAILPQASEVEGFARIDGGYSGRYGGMNVYFVARATRPFARHGVWKAGQLFPGEASRDGADVGAYLAFDTASEPIVELRVGISFVDEAHARQNLEAENAGFDDVRRGAEAAWEKALGVAAIEARSDRDFRMFYTALYHALLMPTLATEADGSYRGIDGEVHQASGFRYYTDFSLWDTFRTLHPLLTLLYPDWQRDMLRSLAAMGRDGGMMPRWPLGVGETGGMVGDSADVVFADSWIKGVRDFDLREAYAVMRKQATGKPPPGSLYAGREGIDEYIARGYVPIEGNSASASKTLEYAYDDFALAALADALGEAADRDAFLARAKSYANLYDETSGFLTGRHADGSFPSMSPTSFESFFAEGNAWQYTFYAPHDIPGLAARMGGRDAFLEKLEQLFTRAACRPKIVGLPPQYYWQGNEIDLFAPWSFAVLDDWTRTARFTRWVMESQYGDGPDGLPGNDDGGTMSAWYVFGALGFFPLAGTDLYFLGSPTLTKATLHLRGGDLVIEAPDARPRARYPSAATWNGAPLARPRVTHAQIASGGTLRFSLRESP
jgi:predicted alpha-1,2-mannosidase